MPLRNHTFLRPLSIALTAIAVTASLYGEEPGPKRRPAIDKIVNEAIGKVRANGRDDDKGNQKILDEASKALEVLADRSMRDGNESEAKAVLQQIKTLKSDVILMAYGRDPSSVQQLTPKGLVGEWSAGKAMSVKIDADGTAVMNREGKSVIHGMTRFPASGTEIRWEEGPPWILHSHGPLKLVAYPYEPDHPWILGAISLERTP